MWSKKREAENVSGPQVVMVEANATGIPRGGKIYIDSNQGKMVTSSKLEKTGESRTSSLQSSCAKDTKSVSGDQLLDLSRPPTRHSEGGPFPWLCPLLWAPQSPKVELGSCARCFLLPHSWLWIEELVAGLLGHRFLTQTPFVGPGV